MVVKKGLEESSELSVSRPVDVTDGKTSFFDCFGSNFSRLSIPVTGYRHTLPNLGMTGSKHTVVQLIPADMAPPESRIRIPEFRSWMSTGLFLGSPGERALWSIQDGIREF